MLPVRRCPWMCDLPNMKNTALVNVVVCCTSHSCFLLFCFFVGRCHTSGQNQISCSPICLYYEPLSNASDSHLLPSSGLCWESQIELKRPIGKTLPSFSSLSHRRAEDNRRRCFSVSRPAGEYLLRVSVWEAVKRESWSLGDSYLVC